MKTIFILFLSLVINAQSVAGNVQSADLHLAFEKKSTGLEVIQFYTYLDTEAEMFEGKDAFEALTFRGDGIVLSFNSDNSKLILNVGDDKLELADIFLNTSDFEQDSIETMTFHSAAKVQLVHASLGKSFKIKVRRCAFPIGGFGCRTVKVKVTPHQYRYEVHGLNGQKLCIERGFNTTAANYGKVSDQYSVGSCQQ